MFRLVLLVFGWLFTAMLDTEGDPPEDPPEDPPQDDASQDEKKHTDDDVNKFKGDARKEERTKLLKLLGVETKEEAEKLVSEYRTIQEATKDDFTKLEEERDKEKVRADKAEAEKRTILINSELKGALRDAGINAQRLGLALVVADTSAVEINEGAVQGLEGVVEAIKKESPEWFSTHEGLPRTPDGDPSHKTKKNIYKPNYNIPVKRS